MARSSSFPKEWEKYRTEKVLGSLQELDFYISFKGSSKHDRLGVLAVLSNVQREYRKEAGRRAEKETFEQFYRRDPQFSLNTIRSLETARAVL